MSELEAVYHCTCDVDPLRCKLVEHEEQTRWFTYLMRNSKGHLYCGVTVDLKRRVYEHNHVRSKASKALWSFRPAELVWYREERSKSHAYKAEARIKKLSHAKKQELVDGRYGRRARGEVRADHVGCDSTD